MLLMRMETKQEFGEWLRDKLEERGWSYSDLADRCGFSRQFVSQMVNGQRGPGTDSVAEIAQALDLPLEYVMRKAVQLPNNNETVRTEAQVEMVELFQRLPVEDQEELLEIVRLRARRRAEVNT